jgi:hypothetical protein
MVFTAQQLTAFFEAADQMAIPTATRIHLQTEGISTVNDLSEFLAADLKQISENLRRPSGRIPDPSPNAPPGATIPQPPFVLGAKSLNRLTAAADLVRYYETVSRTTTPANVKWEPVVKNFMSHWKALTERKKEDNPETPKITRSLPIINWTEAFYDFLHRVIGVRTIPLAYVVRQEVEVPFTAPELANGQPYAEVYGSVEAELIARASHNHPMFREDNAAVYYLLEEATRSTGYAASIKPFQRQKNGRAAWLAIVGQYAGDDKWRALIKASEEIIHTRRWKGASMFSLEKFIGQHRSAFVSLSQCAEHVPYQLPNELSRVTYLLDSIECMDPPLQAAMALVRNDSGPSGKMNDFEATASFILPHDPVARKRTQSATTGKRTNAEISEATAIKGTTGAKARVGPKTGVELRFHTKAEYKNLTQDQRAELKEFRDAREQNGQDRNLSKLKKSGGNSKSTTKGNKRMKTMVAEAVAAAITAKTESDKTQRSEEQQLRDYIVSVMHSSAKDHSKAHVSFVSGTKESSAKGAPEPPVSITKILQRIQPAE